MCSMVLFEIYKFFLIISILAKYSDPAQMIGKSGCPIPFLTNGEIWTSPLKSLHPR